jgi:hypothetical protein
MGVAQSHPNIEERIENLKEKKDISTNNRGKVETHTSCNNDKIFLLFGSWSYCFAMSKQVRYGYKGSQ